MITFEYIMVTFHLTHIIRDIQIKNGVREIKYFAGLNMLSDDDIEVMKQELNRLLDEMEQIAARGEYPNGNKVYLYLSNINFEATYTFLEKGSFQLCMFRL